MLGDSAALGPEGGSGDFPVAITIASAPNDGASNVSGVGSVNNSGGGVNNNHVNINGDNNSGGVNNNGGNNSNGDNDNNSGGGISNSGDDERGRVEEGDKSFGGNRWPRQETLALLKIRSDMDLAFRDASAKGPLWEEVSRKLSELGYHRNAKKCKEKFENVYKYHKRTKEGRSGKSEGKTYRFFDQLQAFENNPTIHGLSIQSPTPKPPQKTTPLQATPLSIVVTTSSSSMPFPPVSNNTTVPSTTTLPISQGTLNITPPSTLNITPSPFPSSNPITYFPTQTPNPTSTTNNNPFNTITPFSFPSIPTGLLSDSSSSSTSSEETTTMEGRATSRKRKRKWKDFFERVMKEVIEKQEEMQRKFLEAIERREQERAAREETWRMQEMQRINRERELLAEERSIAVAKDTAVMSLLQKIAQHQQQEINLEPALNNNNNINITIAPKQPVSQATATTISTSTTFHEAPQAQPLVPQPQQQVVTNVQTNKVDNNGENSAMGGSSSRWPKVEIEALINLRTSLDTKYQENAPKGPLWEEISALMKKMGYNRNAKRCKEKWENINKYFKKVKESSKKRPEDSKTCPYFHMLEALYNEKNKVVEQMNTENTVAPLMVQPEQQWPPWQPVVHPEVSMGDDQNDPMDQSHHKEDNDKEMKDGNEDEDEGKEGGEIVATKQTLA